MLTPHSLFYLIKFDGFPFLVTCSRRTFEYYSGALVGTPPCCHRAAYIREGHVRP